MKIRNAISILSAWDKKIFEILPVRILLALWLVLILFQLNAIKAEIDSIEHGLNSPIPLIGSFKETLTNIENDVSSIKEDMQNKSRK